MLRTAGSLPPRGFRRWAKPSLLPGLLAATRTGLTPAGDDKLALDHELHLDLQLLGERSSQDKPETGNSPLRTGERNAGSATAENDWLLKEPRVICCEECESGGAQLVRFASENRMRFCAGCRQPKNPCISLDEQQIPVLRALLGAPIAARARLLPVSGVSWL